MDNEKINKILETVEENNKILRGLRSVNRWSYTMKILYWLFIIIIAFSAYFFAKPYVEILDNAYNSVRNNVDTLNSVVKKIPTSLR